MSDSSRLSGDRNDLNPVDLIQAVSNLAGGRVITLGDVMLDRFIYGAVERISPEAPIPVLKISRRTSMLGGAGNVLRNLTSLSVSTGLIAVIGDDSVGFEVSRLVEDEEQGAAEGLIAVSERPTTIKERFIASNQQLLRADMEEAGPLSDEVRAVLLKSIANHLDQAGALILSDYGKGVLEADVLQQAITLAQARGCWILADPKGRDYSIYRGVSLITPNRKELQEATGLPVLGDENIVRACQQLIENCGVGAVLATRSEEGMTLVTAEGSVTHFAAEAREVFDVSGAGDTVVAVVAAGLAAGLPMIDSVYLANVAAGLVVGKTGTAVATPSEIRQALRDRSNLLGSVGQVSDLDKTLERIRGWREQGLVVGFTNGCFDIFHPGHVSILHQARSQCDRLVVGLNTDASVRRLKGESRPIQSEEARAAVVAANESVDHVVLFDEDTPLDLIRAILPDVLVKGADYTEEQVVGGAEVKAAGGRVFLAKLEDGHSTTDTVKRIRAAETAEKTGIQK
ncbi:D-glycero-beta-D-manno-heptose-7-phosphate kinase [Kiloniella sp. b19]|uniref:D-glycero-beta-D-manno-heptose-7-phosphate kinase n=1 Tax=Kiloniella sp. GXU_MW_B19 TaxID=3141326 RepID=UPI0031D4B518